MEQLSWDVGGGTFDGIEISGIAVRPILEGLQVASAQAGPLLLAEGIGQPGPSGRALVEPLVWYPLSRCIKAIRELAAGLGDAVLAQIGLHVAEATQLPVWVRDVHEVLRSLDAAYHASHRLYGRSMLDPSTGQLLDGIGHYTYERVDDRKIFAVVSSPYPCAFDRGLLTGRSRRFQPNAWVFHDEHRPCRQRGAAHCTYQVTWL